MKLTKARRRGYISIGEAKIMSHYLSVPKGEDICMLYNGNSSGLNEVIWASHFSLTTVKSTLRATEQGSYTADRDIGEIFLNFMLSKEVRPYCSVDISNIQTEEEWQNVILGGWEIRERKMMGLKYFPYYERQVLKWVNEMALGDKQDQENPFVW